MSKDHPPSPIQPPTATSFAADMAQVHRTPFFPISGSLTGSENRSLPPLMWSAQTPLLHGGPWHNQHTFPSESSNPPAIPSAVRHQPNISLPHTNTPARNILSINNLLSADPEPAGHGKQQQLYHPPRFSPAPSSYEAPSIYSHQSPVSASWNSPDDLRARLRPQSEQAHYISRPHAPFRGSGVLSPRSSPPSPLNVRYIPFESAHDQAKRIPMTALPSSESSYYSHSSAPSPRLSATTVSTFPAQRIISLVPSFDYNLTIRQQPIAARACGFGERDRRVLDPPPIIELQITDKVTGAPKQDHEAMLALHCTLMTEERNADGTHLTPAHPKMLASRTLMGTLVASPYEAKDTNGVAGNFFVFADLSCRLPGKYKIRFKLLRVDPTLAVPGAVHGTVASIDTDVFTAYTPKEFPGMRASSALLIHLRRQGLSVGIKRGSKSKRSNLEDETESSSDDQDDDTEQEDGQNTSRPVEAGSHDGRRRKSKGRRRRKRSKRDVFAQPQSASAYNHTLRRA